GPHQDKRQVQGQDRRLRGAGDLLQTGAGHADQVGGYRPRRWLGLEPDQAPPEHDPGTRSTDRRSDQGTERKGRCVGSSGRGTGGRLRGRLPFAEIPIKKLAITHTAALLQAAPQPERTRLTMAEDNGRVWSPEVKELGDKIVALTVAKAVELGDYMEQVHKIK